MKKIVKLPDSIKEKLKKFVPRSYQWPIIDAIEKDEFKRVLVLWPRRCISGESRILLSNGSWKLLKDIQINDKIVSLNTNTNTFEEDRVINIWNTGIKKAKKVTSLESYISLITSEDHVFATTTCGYKIKWKKLKDISNSGLLIQYPQSYDIFKKSKLHINYTFSAFSIEDTALHEMYDIETEKNHNFIANGFVVHNSGKDITAFNICIRQCLRKVCVVYYIFPTFAQAKRVIWDSITNMGERILDYIPPELIESKNGQEMKIRFINGSLLQLVGSDNYNSLMGTNPYGVVFSEYALQDPQAYAFIRPILAANNGWALFVSTPRGRANHLYALYEIALNSTEWKCIKLSLDDTKHISEDRMQQERKELSEDMIQQEYFCSFDAGIQGSYYAKYVDRMRLEKRINIIAWEPAFQVHTAWDLGVRDSTTIIFFQNVGQTIRIIDCYEQAKVGLEHYVKVLQDKPYTYGKHIAPHDIRVKELGSGMTRLEKARQLGIKFVIAPNISIYDGIESVRSCLGKVWIDENKCLAFVRALEHYRQEYDAKHKVYRPNPLHDWSSHWCDAMRYLAVSLPQTKDQNSSPEDLNRRYNEALYGGSQGHLPAVFRTDLPNNEWSK